MTVEQVDVVFDVGTDLFIITFLRASADATSVSSSTWVKLAGSVEIARNVLLLTRRLLRMYTA